MRRGHAEHDPDIIDMEKNHDSTWVPRNISEGHETFGDFTITDDPAVTDMVQDDGVWRPHDH